MTSIIVLRGPQGATLTLDRDEVYPNDPGAGTPAMVEWNGGTASYTCATSEGEVDADRKGYLPLPQSVLNWLESPKVIDAMEAHLYPED